jgi:tRNA pseudouridine38-40 synthase
VRTFKLTLAYDGTEFCGWQFQPRRRTVQGMLEAVLAKITGQQYRVAASGRTDAGVHALGQVVSFSCDTWLSPEIFLRAINAELPDDMAALELTVAPERFHATRDAVKKRYRYVIHDAPKRDVFARRYSWRHRGRLDAEAMHAAAQHLLGKHDFASFETRGSERDSTVRTVFEIEVRRGRAGEGRAGQGGAIVSCFAPAVPMLEDKIIVEVEADGFLYQMVRTIVGTLSRVGEGKYPASWTAEVLAESDRRAAGPTAPPEGLFLLRVDYENGDVLH